MKKYKKVVEGMKDILECLNFYEEVREDNKNGKLKDCYEYVTGINAPMEVAETEPVDPWVNRSSGMKCRTCMYFMPKAAIDPVQYEPLFKSNGALGRCKRHAPTSSGFPAVFETDSCGDHRLDENKI